MDPSRRRRSSFRTTTSRISGTRSAAAGGIQRLGGSHRRHAAREHHQSAAGDQHLAMATTCFKPGGSTISYIMGALGPTPFPVVSARQPPTRHRCGARSSASSTRTTIRCMSESSRRFSAALCATQNSSPRRLQQCRSYAFPGHRTSSDSNFARWRARSRSATDSKCNVRSFSSRPAASIATTINVLVQPGLLGNVSACLKAFYDATVELGVASSVTTFTQSDFGRTLTSNGDGLRSRMGRQPDRAGRCGPRPHALRHLSRARARRARRRRRRQTDPTTSADQYAATLARWFGNSPMRIWTTVAPHLGQLRATQFGLHELAALELTERCFHRKADRQNLAVGALRAGDHQADRCAAGLMAGNRKRAAVEQVDD